MTHNKALKDRLFYAASLPERLPRAVAAGAGGVVYESSLLFLPEWTRRSQLYQALLGRWLRIAIEWVGGVEDTVLKADAMTAGRLTVRKFAGNVVEFTSIFAVGFSPLWTLAAATDLLDGTQVYLDVLTDELKRLGLLPQEQDFASVDALLESLGGASGALSMAIDIPPLARDELGRSLLEMQESWETLRDNTPGLPSAERLNAIGRQMQETAEREQIPVWLVSALLGVGALQAGMKLGQVHIFDYYRQALGDIQDRGIVAYLRRVSQPYLNTAAEHLDPGRTSYTEFALRKLFRPRAAPAGARRQLASPPPASARKEKHDAG